MAQGTIPQARPVRGRGWIVAGGVVGVVAVAVGVALAVGVMRTGGKARANGVPMIGGRASASPSGTMTTPGQVGGLTGAKGKPKTSGRTAKPSAPKSAKRTAATKAPAAPSKTYAPTPAPSTAATPVAIPWTLQQICGSGMSVIDQHAVGRATIYLMYDGSTGDNCVTTTVPSSTGPVKMSATLAKQGGASISDSGSYSFYAGPEKLYAPKTCVRWGGSYGSASWTSGWSHCG